MLDLTKSATALGLVVALQTLPTLLIGPYAGLIADRVDKRRLMAVLQAMMGVQALVLGVLTLLGGVTFLDVILLAIVLGLNNCFENPARQAFVMEMVGAAELRNAVSLNSTLTNAARAVGPAIAGLLIATVGTGWCFVANAVSFVAVVASLVGMDRSALWPSVPTGRSKGQLRDGFAYVRHTPAILVPLLMMGIVGMLTYEFSVTLPVAARRVFGGGAETYGLMTAAMGIGAVVGGLVVATRGRTGLRALVAASFVFASVVLLAALAPNLGTELAALALVGFASVSFMSIGNATMQLAAEPTMRGRVMSLWAVAFLGTTPIGGPVIGWITSLAGARTGLAVGAAACVVATLLGLGLGLGRRRAASARVAVMAATAPAGGR